MAATKEKARKLLTFKNDIALTERLKNVAAARDVSVSYLIRSALREKYTDSGPL
jgi:predicted transcriptional regulator